MTRVLVNAVAARLGGGARHLGPFVRHLAIERPQNEITLYVPPEMAAQLGDARVTVATRHTAMGLSPSRFAWDQVTVPRLARRFDALLSPLNFGPLFVRRPHLLFERNPIYFDAAFLRTLPARARLKWQSHGRIAVACARRADAVVVPSAAMKQLLVESGVSPATITVVHHGFDPAPAMDADPDQIPPSAHGWRRHELRLLHVGHASAHKNLAVLPEVLRLVRHQGIDAGLALTVPRDAANPEIAAVMAAAEAAGVADAVHYLGAVPQDSVWGLYRASSVFVFPSLTESFGFPLLEAMAAGLPIVASDIPSNREIAAGCARYHAPADAAAAAQLVLAAQSAVTPEDIRARHDAARGFAWPEYARRIYQVLDRICP